MWHTVEMKFHPSFPLVPSPPVDMNLSPMSSYGFIDVTWSPPLTPNGVIMHYVITYNTNTTRTNSTFIRLKVYGDTDYVVGLSACTRPDTGFACSTATFHRFRTPISGKKLVFVLFFL